MINLIPTPKTYQIDEKTVCFLNCSIYTEIDRWKDYCRTFADTFYSLYEVKPEFATGGIVLVKEDSLAAGSYTIESDMSADGQGYIKVGASDDEGILYGISSLIQLIDLWQGKIGIPKMQVEDYPDKDYRAFMVDLGREWHPFDKLLKYVDLCFLYKIKYLHLHIVDFWLYTLPSKAFPKLTVPHKCYTYEQIAELNVYAKERGVVLIPEYECPGHASVMVREYPEAFGNHCEEKVNSDLRDEEGRIIPVESVMCAGSEVCFEANKLLLKEISDLFPDAPYLHIGGDEAAIKAWDYCTDCKKYMEEQGIADVHELYSDFIGRIAEYVLSLGKTPMVWEGFPEKGFERVPKETIVVVFESLYHMPDKLLEEGFRIINSSWQPLYVVPRVNRRWNAFDILKWNVYNWQHFAASSEAFLNPITVAPTEQMLGSMLCAWEQTFEREILLVMENLAAMSERSWTVRRVCKDEEFMPKLQRLLSRAERIIQDK